MPQPIKRDITNKSLLIGCSEETFCSDGAATHVCDNPKHFCWVGITACNAGDWLLVEETAAPINQVTTPSPIDAETVEDDATPTSIETTPSSLAPIENNNSLPTLTPSILIIESITNAPADQPTPDNDATASEPDRFSIKQSFCAENYIELIQECAILDTCNKSPCPDGLTCFKNVLCDRPANTSPGLSAVDDVESPFPSPSPVSPTDLPTTTQVTQSPETKVPSQQPTAFVLSEEEVAQRMSNPNNYCARNLQEILTTCSYALKTCNADDPMCELGTNCFGNIICPGPTNAPAPKTPISVPVIVTTLEPIVIQVEDTAPINPAAQSYCAESGELVQSTCATGFTCNEGSHTCPFGTSCFSNVVCEALQNDLSEPLPSWNIETATIAPISEKPQIKEFTGNYCAESEDVIQSTCKEALICDDGFGTCPFGTFCFSNIVCKALQVQNDETLESSAEECKDLCLKPIESSDCEYVLSLGLEILPCTGMSTQYEQETSMDQICSGTGDCGTSLNLNNCDVNEDLYMRVDVSKCIEAGLGRSGVILSDSSNSITTPASAAESGSLDASDPSASTNDESKANNAPAEKPKEKPNEPIVYSWDDPPNNTTRVEQVDNQAEIDSWWIMKEESGAVGLKAQVVSVVFVGMLLMMQ